MQTIGKQRNKKTAANWVWNSFRFNFIYIIVSNQMRCFSYPEKTADIPRRQHWFPREITSEKRAEKFHTDDASLPRSDWLEICFNQPHLGNDTSSVWNFCTRFSDVISRGNQWRYMTQMSAFFSGYGFPRFCHSLKPIGCCLKNTDLRTKEMASSQY